MKSLGNLIEYSDAANSPTTTSVFNESSKVKKPFVGFVNARVSGKFNRKCIKLNLQEKLSERKMSPVVLSISTQSEDLDESESNASPLTQLANSFGGICTFGTPTSTKSFGRKYKFFVIFLSDLLSGMLRRLDYGSKLQTLFA